MIKKISIEDLKPGMEVVKLSNKMWEHLPFLYAEPGIIESEDQLSQIRSKGFLHAFVTIDRKNSESDEKQLAQLIARREHMQPDKVREPFEQEIRVAQKIYDNAIDHAKRIVNDAKLGRKVDYETSIETVGAIVDSAVRNPDTLVCLSKLSSYDEYTYSHCINVAAISVIFGEYLGLSRQELVNLGIAGLMHDLGKIFVPAHIIGKRGRLTEAEFEKIKLHPQQGCDILNKDNNIPVEILNAILGHHEKYNGSGYPNNLTSKDISGFAHILNLADVYDALTSNRSYKDAILPNKALAIMYGMRGQDFDPLEIQHFIKCLGIFPSGSLVKLNSGFYGLVYQSNPSSPLMPKIKIILDQDLHPVPSRLVDLAAQESMGKGKDKGNLEILDCADPSVYKINLKPYLTRIG